MGWRGFFVFVSTGEIQVVELMREKVDIRKLGGVPSFSRL